MLMLHDGMNEEKEAGSQSLSAVLVLMSGWSHDSHCLFLGPGRHSGPQVVANGNSWRRGNDTESQTQTQSLNSRVENSDCGAKTKKEIKTFTAKFRTRTNT